VQDALEALQGLSGQLVSLGFLHGLWIGLVAASLVAFVFQIHKLGSTSVRHVSVINAFYAIFGDFVCCCQPLIVALWLAGVARGAGTPGPGPWAKVICEAEWLSR
jgi:hypothetical protein